MADRREGSATVFSSVGYFPFLLILWAIALIPFAYYSFLQSEEEKFISEYLAENQLTDLAITKESAVRVSQQIRSDFNVDRSTWTGLTDEVDSKRPFLQFDTKFLLTHKEGWCGIGSRVLVNLLVKSGFDATRLVLYDRRLAASHTLVSVMIGDKEYLVDSINSSEKANAYLNSHDISTADFNIMGYIGDIDTRNTVRESLGGNKFQGDKFFDRFKVYSYEALPFSKLLEKAGYKGRAFNFYRPPVTISMLAEKPNLARAVAAFAISLIIIFVLHFSGIARKLHTAIQR